MELFIDLGAEERLALGLFSFIALIVYLHCMVPLEDQKKVRPPEVPKRQAEND